MTQPNDSQLAYAPLVIENIPPRQTTSHVKRQGGASSASKQMPTIVPLAVALVAGLVCASLFLMMILVIAITFSQGPTVPSGSLGYESSALSSDPWESDFGHGYNSNEFRGAAEFGGIPFTSGTFDSSGQGAHVISQGNEVFNLPPY